LDVTALRQRLQRLPAPVIDAGLAVALALATAWPPATAAGRC
jgi:hypothetical protein